MDTLPSFVRPNPEGPMYIRQDIVDEMHDALVEASGLCVGTFAEGGSPHKRILAALARARGETA